MDIPGYFDRLLRIAQRSEGPVIISRNDEDEPLVVMTLQAYEGLIDGRGKAHVEPVQEAGGYHVEEDIGRQQVAYDSEEISPRGEKSLSAPQTMRPRRPIGGMREYSDQKGESRLKSTEMGQNKRPITRRAPMQDDSGEERFYLESL